MASLGQGLTLPPPDPLPSSPGGATCWWEWARPWPSSSRAPGSSRSRWWNLRVRGLLPLLLLLLLGGVLLLPLLLLPPLLLPPLLLLLPPLLLLLLLLRGVLLL